MICNSKNDIFLTFSIQIQIFNLIFLEKVILYNCIGGDIVIGIEKMIVTKVSHIVFCTHQLGDGAEMKKRT